MVASDGLVRLEPNRGAWVTRVTVAEVEEVFPVLAALEALAGQLACDRITGDEIAAIRALHQDMQACFDARDLDGYFRLNQNIHAAIVASARNPTLSASCQALSLRVLRARFLANMSEDRWRDAMVEHEEILRLIEVRDGAALGDLLARHLLAKQDAVLRWLKTGGA
ncbi:MAG: GntR family transcriptional regulator [Pseudomonadota bacterium]